MGDEWRGVGKPREKLLQMTQAKKPTKARKAAGGQSKAVASALVLAALEQLKDPKVRAQLVEHGQTVANAAKAWRADRSSRPSAPASGAAVSVAGDAETSSKGLGDRFGQRKLERRLLALRESMSALEGGSPDLVSFLTDMSAALDGISTALEVAGRLPLVKRKQAHHRIDHELDQLERGLFEACMRNPT